MKQQNLKNLKISSDACRHMQPRLCIEMMRAWREAERRSRAPLTWLELVNLFNAHCPNPYAEEVRKSCTAIMAAADIDSILEQVTATLDARPVSQLYPSRKSHEAMRAALFEAKMAAGGKRLYELFFRYLDLSESAGTVHRSYGDMMLVVDSHVADWPLGQKLAAHIMEMGLREDGLTFAQLQDGCKNTKKTLADVKLETTGHPAGKFFIVTKPRHSHA